MFPGFRVGDEVTILGFKIFQIAQAAMLASSAAISFPVASR